MKYLRTDSFVYNLHIVNQLAQNHRHPLDCREPLSSGYFQSNRPGLRLRILRELVREEEREQLSPSPRHERRLVSRLTDFDSLNPLSIDEMRLFKSFLRLSIHQTLESHFEKIEEHQAGDFVYLDDRENGLFLSMSDPNFYGARIQRDSGPTNDRAYGSRGIETYKLQYGIDLEEMTHSAEKKNQRPVHVLDVGSCTGLALYQLKQSVGDAVRTHALQPFDEPRYPSDFYHMLMAEHIPHEFHGAFDVISSATTLRYSIFPDKALRNIADMLAPGGEARVVWDDAGTWFSDPISPHEAKKLAHQNEFVRLYSERFRSGEISTELYRFLDQFMEEQEQRRDGDTPAKLNSRTVIASQLENPNWVAYQTLAWSNALFDINNDSRFTVEPNWETQYLNTWWHYPASVIIRRS